MKMKITHALLGEHGAIYPLLDLVEETGATAGLVEIKTQARLLHAALISHADIEDALLRPAIESYLPRPAPAPDGSISPTDHQAIGAGLRSVIEAGNAEQARRLLTDTVFMIRKHFKKEEKIIFAIAERQLSAEFQDELGARWAALRKLTVNGSREWEAGGTSHSAIIVTDVAVSRVQ